MITGRRLARDEIPLLWTIDRSEVIENIYYFNEGTLALKPGVITVRGWPENDIEKYTPWLKECHAAGGWFYGIFHEAKLAAAAVLDARYIGPASDHLALKFLYVDCNYRHQGLGTELFKSAKAVAESWTARRIYISAAPSQNTVDFYLNRGCRLVAEPDPELFALEPNDIHLECDL